LVVKLEYLDNLIKRDKLIDISYGTFCNFTCESGLKTILQDFAEDIYESILELLSKKRDGVVLELKELGYEE
jgi:hypothetical protein